jgi:hypothetical protein
VRPFLLGVAVACIVTACGSENRRISESIPPNPIAPTPPPPSPTALGPIVIHDSLNVPGDRNILDLYGSTKTITYISMISGLLPTRMDDFTSEVTGTIRTVSWQGGYCRSGKPREDSNPFHVSLIPDNNGRPVYPWASRYDFRLTPAEWQEQFAFEVVRGDASCYYYDYTAVLPTPFPVTAGTRYWLQIVALRDDANWSWRAGKPDNGISARESRLEIDMQTRDLAFSLSSE